MHTSLSLFSLIFKNLEWIHMSTLVRVVKHVWATLSKGEQGSGMSVQHTVAFFLLGQSIEQ